MGRHRKNFGTSTDLDISLLCEPPAPSITPRSIRSGLDHAMARLGSVQAQSRVISRQIADAAEAEIQRRRSDAIGLLRQARVVDDDAPIFVSCRYCRQPISGSLFSWRTLDGDSSCTSASGLHDPVMDWLQNDDVASS